MSRKIKFILIYVLFVGVIYISSSTLAKYTTEKNTTGEFYVGEKLYFHYQRGDLFRNNQLTIGIPVEEVQTNEDGTIKKTSRRIETMDVSPGDNLTYQFYVSNLNEETTEYNGILGIFHVSVNAILSMPVHQANYELSCRVTYRQINEDGSTSAFKDLTKDVDLPLQISDGMIKQQYEFQISVILDDQVVATSNDDYIGATLSIYLFIDAANDISKG